MSQKHILLADADAKTGEEFRMALGQEWIVKVVGTGAAALEELKAQAYDGLVASLHLPDVGTSQLLNKVRSKYPKTVRFVVASENDRERVVKEVLGAHQFLIRPFDAEGLRTTIERALAFDLWIDNDKIHKLVARMRSLPTVPALYLEILTALRAADTTTEEIGEIIAKDMAITTKLLQVINSAYFGLPRTVTSPSEAVGLLGFETVKSMVMAVKLLNQYDRIKMGDFSVERLWQHSTAVANNARRLVMLQTGERALAEEAFAAGLMHDVGKAVLAGNFSEQYQGALSLAKKQKIPLWTIEKEIFGASHGEIGAYLLGLWGLPLGVLEAAALHHQPSRASNKVFTALTAVHVGNALQHQAETHLDGEVLPELEMEYLSEIGMLECLPSWRNEILGPEAAESEVVSEPDSGRSVPGASLASTPPPEATLSARDESLSPSHDEPTEPALASNEPACASATPGTDDSPTISEGEPSSEDSQDPGAMQGDESLELVLANTGQLFVSALPEADFTAPPSFTAPASTGSKSPKHLFAVCVAALLGLLIAGVILGRLIGHKGEAIVVKAEPVNSPPATNGTESGSLPSSQAREKAQPVVTAQVEQTNATVRPENASSSPASDLSVASTESSTNAATPEQPVVHIEPSFPELRLQGILYSPRKPAAIINGLLVHTNELVLGVRIVQIRPGAVVIEYQHQHKVLSLE